MVNSLCNFPSPGDGGIWPAPLSLAGEIGRRGFLQASLGCMAGAASLGAFATVPDGGASKAAPQGFWSQPRWVWLRRLGTKEEIKTYYWRDGQLDQQAYQKICWFLRDRRFESLMAQQSPVLTHAVTSGRVEKSQLTPWALMDPIVVDILYAYCSWLSVYGVSRPLDVTSGFRHFLTNSMTEPAQWISPSPVSPSSRSPDSACGSPAAASGFIETKISPM